METIESVLQNNNSPISGNVDIITLFTNCRETLDQHVNIKKIRRFFIWYYEYHANPHLIIGDLMYSTIEKKELSNIQGYNLFILIPSKAISL